MSNRPTRSVLPLTARTATTDSPAQHTDADVKGVLLIINFTVQAGAETLTPVIQIRDAESGLWLDYTTNFTALSAIGTHFLILYPSVNTGQAAAQQVRNLPLPNNWRLRVAHSSTGAHTYSVALQMLD